MSSVGRNEPCPCGSRRKYKKCHGAPSNESAGLMDRTHKSAPTMQMDIMGVPGLQHHLLMRPHYANPHDPRNFGALGGVPGKYKVVFTLSRPGFSLLPELRFSAASGLKGNSHIGIAEPALKFLDGETFDQIRFDVGTPFGEFRFMGYANDEGFLGKIESEEFDAGSLSDAALRAHQALARSLSNMSVYLDVPVNIYQVDVTEIRTGSVRMSLRAPHKVEVGLIPPADQITEDQQMYSSLYREALNSNSSNYQFLCLYRLIEGLRERRNRLKGQLALHAKSEGKRPPSYLEEKIPSDKNEQIEWLNALFASPREWDAMALDSVFTKEIVGRRVNNLIDKREELHSLRNKIAHAVLDSGEPIISIDNGVDIEEVEKWLPITKFLARFLLKDAFPDIFKTA